jgi:hypothetical protein
MACIDTWACTAWFWAALLLQGIVQTWPVFAIGAVFLLFRDPIIRFVAVAIVLFAAVSAVQSKPLMCSKVVRDFHDAWGNEEDYIWSFPVHQAARVRTCLDRHWKVMQK